MAMKNITNCNLYMFVLSQNQRRPVGTLDLLHIQTENIVEKHTANVLVLSGHQLISYIRKSYRW
jgi:hypothetical protein